MVAIKIGTLTWIQLLLWTNIADMDVNVARGKPTFASSVYCGSTNKCGSQFVVDGNYKTRFLSYSCFATNDPSGGPNWWAVDMRQLVFVDQVIATNRADETGCEAATPCGMRLDNFIVGLTNVTPSLNTVIRGSYPICGVYPGHVPGSFNASVQCAPGSPPARHLIIQQPTNGPGWLQFCEVEVWTKHTMSQWKRESGIRLENYVSSSSFVGCAMDCMVLCQEAINGCDSFNHRPIDNACELNSHSAGFSPSAKIASSAWNWWTTYY